MGSLGHDCCKFVVLEFAKALRASFKEAKKKEDEEGRQGPLSFKAGTLQVRQSRKVLIVPGAQRPAGLDPNVPQVSPKKKRSRLQSVAAQKLRTLFRAM